MTKTKPFSISKHVVWEAYQRVKSNKGSAGVDQQSIAEFEVELKANLYRIWNRMSSGSYFPPPIKAVPIPKKSGGERILGVPTVADRIAQTVVTLTLEPMLEPHFHEDSYGYRPGKSAHQALTVTRKRCWQHDWVLEYDIRGLFDNIDHELLLKALRHHVKDRWVLLYVERWLTAPMQQRDGSLLARDRGTPQGGPLSPVLANLFLHYALDHWLNRTHAHVAFCRYADDGILHCRSESQALYLREQLAGRLKQCGLELHPQKTRIVYCKDANRTEQHEAIQFDFLGFTFKPRWSKNRHGVVFLCFGPSASRQSLTAIRQKVRSWRLHLKSGTSLRGLAAQRSATIRGWINYYGYFRSSELQVIARHIDRVLVRWAMRKYKRLHKKWKRAVHWLEKQFLKWPQLFPHWGLSNWFSVGTMGAQ